MKESGNSNPAPTVQAAPVTTDPTKQAIITQLTQAVLSCPDNVTLDKAGTVFTLFLTPGFANWLDEVYNKVIASINQQTKP